MLNSRRFHCSKTEVVLWSKRDESEHNGSRWPVLHRAAGDLPEHYFRVILGANRRVQYWRLENLKSFDLEVLDSLIVLALFGKRRAEIIKGLEIIWLNRQRLTDEFDGSPVLQLLQMHFTLAIELHGFVRNFPLLGKCQRQSANGNDR